jgi:excinuclease ABC subunit A
MEIDPELVVPDPSLSIGDGAILPWSSGATTYYEQITQAIAERYEIDLEAPWESLPQDQQDLSCTAPTATGCTSPTATGWAASART